jgi:pimeloyl-ACP methyl ester carboxylesterase
MTSELHELLQLAGERPPFVLVAHSFGGLIAAEYASRYPKDVAGFVFVDAATKETDDAIDAAYPQFLNGTGKAVALARAASVAARFGITRLLRQPAAPRGFDPTVRPEAYALGYQPKVYAAFADETAAFRDNVAHARTSFPRNVPAIVLTHGEVGDMFRGLPSRGADEIWQREQAALAGSLRGAQHEVVRGAGHFIQIDKPEAVVEAIRHVVMEVKAQE